MLELVQNKFLRFISFKFDIFRHSHSSYNVVLNFLNLVLLNDRRLLLLLKFSHKFLTGAIDCPKLLSLINFKINSLNTRNSLPLYPDFSNKNYILNSASNILMNAGNTYVFDFI